MKVNAAPFRLPKVVCGKAEETSMVHRMRELYALLLIVSLSGALIAQVAHAQISDPGWQVHDLGAARFAVPSDWTGEKFPDGETIMLASPDDERTLWVSWWQPDEPLLGYDDIVSHAAIQIDGYQALRVHSRFPEHDAISITLDAVRNDGRRLQFLFERRGDLSRGDPFLDQILERVRLGEEAVLGKAHDSTEDAVAGGGEWQRYVNARFGTVVEVPSALLQMLPPPENDDGRSFEGINHDLTVLVFASHNVFDMDVSDRVGELTGGGAFERISRIEASDTRLYFEGQQDGQTVRLSELYGPDNVIHTLRISHDPALADLFADQLERMEASFSVDQPETKRAEPEVEQAEVVFWQSIADSTDPADFRAYLAQWPEGVFAPLAHNRLSRLEAAGARPSHQGIEAVDTPSSYHEPVRGSAERAAIMDAAREPVSATLRQDVIFVVERLRSDGRFAYLQAVPHRPDGTPLNWGATPFAHEWRGGFMSDVVMVLLRKIGGDWHVLDYVVGPTDVYWVSWKDEYGLPDAIFHD